ncbi:Hypothetical predicted protein [Olea europaea subsp. europaea]|uniref:Uncharacterized protein n=1 Tax=Olea europaea subsp. europaea TaxID=158383 RepID=A0A8S0QNF4_OLEEU|nr:Hypothetical predicted protein [Olea europaea subsp. europaea]
MGNWCGKKLVVHPFADPGQSGSTVLRVKVKMRVKELQELIKKVEKKGKGIDADTMLGRLILRECLDGRLQACVTPATEVKYINQTPLPTIKE